MEDVEQLADFLLVRGYHMTSLELLAEMRSKSQHPPANLTKFFSDPAKFEAPKSSLEKIESSEHLPSKRMISSPIFFDESDVLSASDKSCKSGPVY